MVYDHCVTIGPEFFAKAKHVYSDWRAALAREFEQNSIDSGASTIDITIRMVGELIEVCVANNGKVMDEDTIINKLLALGSSGKDFQNTIGGFGLAKDLLYLSNESYQIRSGNLMVVGSGAGYNLSTTTEYYAGTESTVLIKPEDEHTMQQLIDSFKLCIYMTQWHGTFKVNGTTMYGKMRKGAKRREFDWATVYTNLSMSYYMIVRISGMPMFHRRIGINKCVIVELNGSSKDVLQSSRDNLKWEYQSKLNAFIDEITVDKASALSKSDTTYDWYDGEEICINDVIPEQHLESAVTNPDEEPADQPMIAAKATTPDMGDQRKIDITDVDRSRCGVKFVIKNSTGLQVPQCYKPTHFSTYSKRLIKLWVATLVKLHRVFKKNATFHVGFGFDENDEANYLQSGKGIVFLINPVKIIPGPNNSRSMSKRYKLDQANKWNIVALACHEFVHSYGLLGHDELYSSKLTDLIGTMLHKRKEFTSCLR